MSLTAQELHTHSELAGEGPRVLFIPGSNADLRGPRTVFSGPLPGSFDVLSYDHRGTGRTRAPAGDWTMLDYAEDAIAVLDAEGWDKAHVVGYSFGGMVAQELAIRWPERVDRLVLAASTAGGAGGASYPIQEFAGLPPREQARRRLEVADLGFTPEWQKAHPEEAEARIAKRMAAQARFADEPGQAEGKTRLLAARAAHDTYERLDRITAPTLVLAGERDGQAPLAAQRAMCERISGATFETVDGSHGMLWETDEVWDRIARFLNAD